MDANALMMPVECGVRVFEELDRLLGTYDPVVPRAVVEELRALGVGSGEEARAASVALDLAERCAVLDHEEPYADDALVELALRGAVDAVVTNDASLRERLLEADTQVIHLRGRNQLARIQP